MGRTLGINKSEFININRNASKISAKLGWSKIAPFLNGGVPTSIAQGAAALVANLTTNGNI